MCHEETTGGAEEVLTFFLLCLRSLRSSHHGCHALPQFSDSDLRTWWRWLWRLESLPNLDFVLGLSRSHGIFVGRGGDDQNCAWGRLIRLLSLCASPAGRLEVAT